MGPILIIDDDRSIRELLRLHLEERGFGVICAATAGEGEALAARTQPAAVVLDVNLPDASGLERVESLRRASGAPVLIITAFHDMATTIIAMKSGAFDYIRKPLDIVAFDAALNRAIDERRASESIAALDLTQGSGPSFTDLVGKSPPMQEIFKQMGMVASSRASVLVRGESGTGKELVARVVHQYSCPSRPFIAVNCAAVVETLLESELFGHERGAFTGAVSAKAGKCELAEDGTLFLDEIGDLSLNLQGKLLRLLQEREFERVGGVRKIPLRARIVTATHRDLAEAVRRGAFRQDLYQRLRVVTLELPPLRERREDIPVLVAHLLNRINGKQQRHVLKVPEAVMRELANRPWYGNVRELENALTRAVVMAPGDVLLADCLPPPAPPPVQPLPFLSPEPEFLDDLPYASAPEQRTPTPRSLPPSFTEVTPLSAADPGQGPIISLDEMERMHIARALEFTGGHRGRTCELLGITRPTLDRKIRKYGLIPPSRSASRRE